MESMDRKFLDRFLLKSSVVWRPLVIAPLSVLVFLVVTGGAEIGVFFILLTFGVLTAVNAGRMVRKIFPGSSPEDEFEPWLPLFMTFSRVVFRFACFVATFRGALFVYAYFVPGFVPFDWLYIGQYPESAYRALAVFNMGLGALGAFYGIAGILRESAWNYRQAQQVSNLATSKTRSAAIGLSEFAGKARAISSAGGPVTNQCIMNFDWKIFSHSETWSSGRMVNKFYLEDETGKILVDPGEADLQVQRPFFTFLFYVLGRRPYLAALTRRVEKGLWPSISYSLFDGDLIYLIGHVAERADAPQDAFGPDRLVVRPRPGPDLEADIGRGFRFLAARKKSRGIQDVFFISDTTEQTARDLLMDELWKKALWGLVCTILSAALFEGSSRLFWQ